jgi:hypothetical protein
MARNKPDGHKYLGLRLTGTLAALAFLFSIWACSFNLPRNTLLQNPTDVANSVKATINAETVATLQAQQTLDAVQPSATRHISPNTNATIQAQQATLDAQSTALSPQETQPAPAGTAQVTASLAPGGSLNPVILLQNWKPNGDWAQVMSCPFEGICWTDSPAGNYGSGRETSITSLDSVTIDPTWPKPALVFWMSLALEGGYDVAHIDIKSEKNANWREIFYFKNVLNWNEVSIPLDKFVGQTFYFRFRLEADALYSKDGWYLQNIRIEPNYNR